jgi:hypothetical protein
LCGAAGEGGWAGAWFVHFSLGNKDVKTIESMRETQQGAKARNTFFFFYFQDALSCGGIIISKY